MLVPVFGFELRSPSGLELLDEIITGGEPRFGKLCPLLPVPYDLAIAAIGATIHHADKRIASYPHAITDHNGRPRHPATENLEGDGRDKGLFG